MLLLLTVINITAVPSSGLKVGCGTAKQQVKNNRTKRRNSDVPRFQYKVFFSHKAETISLTLCQSSEHLQALLTKLLGQFIEIHNTQFFQRLENLT